MVDERSDRRSRIPYEVLMEAIDRNRRKGWEEYRQTFDFTLLDGGTIRVSPKRAEREDVHI